MTVTPRVPASYTRATHSYIFLLLTLSLVLGATYLFIKVAVRQLQPAAMTESRLILAAVFLFGFAAARNGVRGATREMVAVWRPACIVGLIGAALPFTLVAWGETHIDSGVAAIVNAMGPIFVILLSVRSRSSDRVTGLRLAGVLCGVAGAGVLVGVHPSGGWWAVAGTLAAVLASFSGACSGFVVRASLVGRQGSVLAGAAMIAAALFLLPLALVEAPDRIPGWEALASVSALGVLTTAIGQVLIFRSIRLHGVYRTSLVTYLIPATALLYGFVVINESLTAAKLGGMLLILVGVTLGSRPGMVRPQRPGETRPQQPGLGQLAQPGRLRNIGLPARHLLDMTRVHKQQRELAFQDRPHRLPKHPSRFHRHLLHPMSSKPIAQAKKAPHRCRELRNMLLATLALRRRNPHTRGHLRLVDIQRRRALNDRLHNPPPGNSTRQDDRREASEN